MPSNQSRYEVLDGIRGIASFTVLFHHFTQFGPHPIFQHATVAVDLFFMLSGFVIMHSYGNKLRTGLPALEYVKKRFIRLYPMFILAVLAGTVAYIFCREFPPGISNNTELISITALNAAFIPFLDYKNTQHDFVVVFPTNGPLWSLFFEMFASLAFIVLCRLSIRKIGLFCLMCLAGVFCVIAFYLVNDISLGIVTHTGWGSHVFAAGFVRVLFGFTLGIFIYQNMESIQTHRFTIVLQKIPCKSILLAIAFLVFVAFPFEAKGLYKLLGILLVMPAFLIVGALTICENDNVFKICRFLGWISYPLYCLHMPVGMIVKSANESVFGLSYYSFISQTSAFLVSIAVAAVVTKYYDEPVRAWLSRKSQRAIKQAVQ